MTDNIKQFLDADALRDKGEWSSSKQDGVPGHCFQAQVWDSNGNNLAVIEPTGDENEASATAAFIAAASRIAPDIRAMQDAFEQVCEAATDVANNWQTPTVEHYRALARSLSIAAPFRKTGV